MKKQFWKLDQNPAKRHPGAAPTVTGCMKFADSTGPFRA
jgi:hypothetical protein